MKKNNERDRSLYGSRYDPGKVSEYLKRLENVQRIGADAGAAGAASSDRMREARASLNDILDAMSGIEKAAARNEVARRARVRQMTSNGGQRAAGVSEPVVNGDDNSGTENAEAEDADGSADASDASPPAVTQEAQAPRHNRRDKNHSSRRGRETAENTASAHPNRARRLVLLVGGVALATGLVVGIGSILANNGRAPLKPSATEQTTPVPGSPTALPRPTDTGGNGGVLHPGPNGGGNGPFLPPDGGGQEIIRLGVYDPANPNGLGTLSGVALQVMHLKGIDPPGAVGYDLHLQAACDVLAWHNFAIADCYGSDGNSILYDLKPNTPISVPDNFSAQVAARVLQ